MVKVTLMGVVVTLGDPLARVTVVEDEGPQPPPPPPASGPGQPDPTTHKEQQCEHQVEKRAASPSTPTVGGLEKGENAKKRKLNWHS